jgi:hypothetical protein
MTAPTLDDRSADKVLLQAQALAATFVGSAWAGAADPGDPAFQLLRVFSRLMEILLERLNKVPDKNFLAFLDMVGVEPSPGAPAAVPLTFVPSPKAALGGLIPAGTQVATTQTEKADAQIFETREAIFATPAKLTAIVNLAPGSDRFAAVPPPALPPKLDPGGSAAPTPEWVVLSPGAAGLADVPHVMYLGSATLFGRKETLDLTLLLQVGAGDASLLTGANVKWSKLDKTTKTWLPLAPGYSLGLAGDLRVLFPSFGNADKSTIAGVEDVWLACSFVGAPPAPAQQPQLQSVAGTLAPAGAATSASEEPALASFGATPLDLSRPWKPFGDRPRFGDAFYLNNQHAFAPEVDRVTVTFDLKAYKTADLQKVFQGLTATTAPMVVVTTAVQWQYLASGGLWKPLVRFEHTLTPGTLTAPALPTITRAFSSTPAAPAGEEGTLFGLVDADSASFSFARPSDMAAGKVNGQDGFWIRAVLDSDDPFGRDAFLVAGSPPTAAPATLVPPIVKKATLTYTYRAGFVAVDHLITENNFAVVEHGSSGGAPAFPLQPFAAPGEVTLASVPGGQPAFGADPAVYLGFDQPFGDVFVSLYLKLRDVFPSVKQPAETGHPLVKWEYLAAGAGWKPLDVQDATADLTGSGTVSFLGPSDFVAAALFGAPAVPKAPALFWLRARLSDGRYDYPPALQGIFPNTVMADNQQTFPGDVVIGETVSDEQKRSARGVVIGSGNGEENQRVTLLKAPVLAGDLWVREPEPPPQDELDHLVAELRGDGLTNDDGTPIQADDVLKIRAPLVAPVTNVVNPLPTREVWVRWRRVPNFFGSGSRSRHFALDPLSGVLLLGDGKEHGLLPPVSKDNLVLRNYRVGGGETAARVAVPLAIKELKTSLPYVEKVFNVEAATGGSNPWDLDQIFQFGPQLLKNKGRAVSTEDFEATVLQQFSQVARAKCLARTAPGPGGLLMKPGSVTMIVVPRGPEREPHPSSALLLQIRDFLTHQCLGNIGSDVHVLGPGFFPVTVKARVRASDPRESSEVERRAVRALEAFFHPLTGGEQGTGWPFGRDVQTSEVFAVLQAVEGVDYVAAVELHKGAGGTADIGKNDLVSSGSHTIEMI